MSSPIRFLFNGTLKGREFHSVRIINDDEKHLVRLRNFNQVRMIFRRTSRMSGGNRSKWKELVELIRSLTEV